MSLPLRIPFFVFVMLLGCSKKEADPQSESTPPIPDSAPSAAPVSSPSASSAPSAVPVPITVPAAPASAIPHVDGGPTCGVKPLPDCPLQDWMKRNTAAAMTANDLPTLAFAFDQMIPLGPPGYTNWASISRDGAAAARIGDASAVKAACRGCHDQYRTKYRTELRARPIP